MSNGTVKLQAPKGTTQVSVEQQIFNVDADGTVTVPFPFVERLKGHGFVPAPGRVLLVGGGSVSDEEKAELIRKAPLAANQQGPEKEEDKQP